MRFSGEGSDTYQVSGTGHGYDSYDDNGTVGIDTIVALSNNTRIGLSGDFSGLVSGIEAIDGDGNTGVYVSGDGNCNTLDFSGMTLTGIAFIDGAGGDDVIIGTAGDDTIRGNTGNDTLDGGEGSDTYQVSGTGHGYDSFTDTGTAGTDTVVALSNNTDIGLLGDFGSANGIEEFSANGFANTDVKGDNTANTLDFSGVVLTDIARVLGQGGDDLITVSRSFTGNTLYDGGTGQDTLQIKLTLAEVLNPAIDGELNAFNGALPAPQGAAAPFSFTTLGFRAVNFETFEGLVDIGGFTASFENVILGSGSPDTITPALVSGSVTGNPPPSDFKDFIFGFNSNDVIDGGGGNDVIIGAHGNDTLNGGEGDDFFLYSGNNNGSDAVSGDGGTDTIVITSDNTIVGLNGFDNSVEIIDALNTTGSKVTGTGTGDVLNFSDVRFDNVNADFEIDGGNNDDVITTSNQTGGLNYRGGHGNDTFNISTTQAATFLYSGTNNGADTFTGNTAGDGVVNTIRVESAGTIIGLNGFANGVDVIDVAGHANVEVQGTTGNDVLDFSEVAFSNVGAGFEIDGGNSNDDITTSNQTGGLNYRGGHGNDTFNISASQAATFLYSGTNNGADTFTGNTANDLVVNTIRAEADGTLVGLNGFANGVDVIDVAGHANVELQGTTGNDVLDFSEITFSNVGAGFEVDAGNSNETITASNKSAVSYRGGHGDDTLNAGEADATWLYTGANNGSDTFTNNATGVSIARADAAGTVIGVNGYANDGVDEFIGTGDTIIRDTSAGHTLDFTNTRLTNITNTRLTNIGRVEGANGNDFVTTAFTANVTGTVTYDGGANTDTLRINMTLAQASSQAVAAQFNAYVASLPASSGVEFNFSTLGFKAINFGNVELFLTVGEFSIATSYLIVGTPNHETLNVETVAGGVTTNPYLVFGLGGNDTLIGSDGNDVFGGGAGNDTLQGGNGDDTILVGLSEGEDIFQGGAGTDTILAAADNVEISILTNFDASSSIEEISANGFSDVTIHGSGNHNILDFSSTTFTGIDTIDGEGGNDVITGTAAADVIIGGTGNDTMNGGAGDDIFQIGLGHGDDTFNGGADTDTVIATANNVEIGILTNFDASNSIEEISAGGFSGVTIHGSGNHNNLDFSATTRSSAAPATTRSAAAQATIRSCGRPVTAMTGLTAAPRPASIPS